jgi:putative membrane protein
VRPPAARRAAAISASRRRPGVPAARGLTTRVFAGGGWVRPPPRVLASGNALRRRIGPEKAAKAVDRHPHEPHTVLPRAIPGLGQGLIPEPDGGTRSSPAPASRPVRSHMGEKKSIWRGLWLFAGPWQYVAMKLLLRILIPAVALGVAHLLISGIELTGHSDAKKAGTLVIIALIFGVVNAVLKPIIKTIGCLFYVLTLGLIGLVVNGLLLWLCSWIAGKLTVPFHITTFWAAFWGAIIVGIVGWLLNLVFDEKKVEARH